MFLEPKTEIVLHDDGLRVTKRGNIGQYPFIVIQNPEHVSLVLAVKHHRDSILQANYRTWGDELCSAA